MLMTPILQFGTGRFLLAHVDLFVSEALAAGQALGGILVVQTTDSATSTARTVALAGAAPYPVQIRGRAGGQVVDRTVWCHSVVDAVRADAAWDRVVDAMSSQVRVIVSNTADQGYRLEPADDAGLIDDFRRVPRSFPAKLLTLLLRRWQRIPLATLSILPCELVARNGDTLRDVVCELATAWRLPGPFVLWLRQHCVWANTLVDRIVSEAIEPVGAIAEPYALWAVQRHPGLVLPCRHPDILLVDDLGPHQRLKLHLLNAGHTFLAERWQRLGLPDGYTVLQAMHHEGLRADLESLWADEILPVLAALGEGDAAARYVEALRERLLNPFLAHRLADIARDHESKKRRRLAPIVALAARHRPALAQPLLRAALAPDFVGES